MIAQNTNGMSLLKGFNINRILKVKVCSDESDYDYVTDDCIIFCTDKGVVQILANSFETKLEFLEDLSNISLSYEMEEDEWLECFEINNSLVPFEINRIVEYWIGNHEKKSLLGVFFLNSHGKELALELGDDVVIVEHSKLSSAFEKIKEQEIASEKIEY